MMHAARGRQAVKTPHFDSALAAAAAEQDDKRSRLYGVPGLSLSDRDYEGNINIRLK